MPPKTGSLSAHRWNSALSEHARCLAKANPKVKRATVPIGETGIGNEPMPITLDLVEPALASQLCRLIHCDRLDHRLGSLFLTLPTRGLTAQQIISPPEREPKGP